MMQITEPPEPTNLEEFVKIAMYLIALWAVFFLTGCSTVSTAPAPKEETAPEAGWSYDMIIHGNLALEHFTPRGDLCPTEEVRFPVFWAALWKATAYVESGWHSDSTYTEKFTDSEGVRQVSRGLLQLSYDDEGRGPNCKNLRARIYEPETNLLCGLDIAKQLIKQHKKPTLRENLGRYWSTIRDGKVIPLLRKYVPDCFRKMDAEAMESYL